ncbi:MAG TPA: ankyrin repeat domain-containing protein [Gemmatimonadales bacterium]|nr:ankyrin repeat domain-containing protein [Gemmatimonadales bacterium]
MAQVPVGDLRVAFIEAACWHGTLERAEAMLVEHPELRSADIHLAAILGDEAAVRRFIARDPASVTAQSPPWGGDPLNYLGLSKYLRLHPERTEDFVRTAAALLDAGAPAHTGFWTAGEHPEFETALYGAAGVAHNAPLTRLLIERGADPNDEDAVYHAPEGHDLGALKVLVETGRVIPEHLLLMLLRKLDWHDPEGVRYLLTKDIDLGRRWKRAGTALHHALDRDNSLQIIELLLDHGADPHAVDRGRTAIALAARKGRSDVLKALERRGVTLELRGVERLHAALARADATAAHAIAKDEPALLREVLADGGTLLSEFTLTWNNDGVRLLLELGAPATARYDGYGYFDIANDSTALHVAAWMLNSELVRLLLERGVPANARDGRGRTPLMLAVKACVDSYWTERRTPEPARLLLEAGASLEGVGIPTGYDELDDVLRHYEKRGAKDRRA